MLSTSITVFGFPNSSKVLSDDETHSVRFPPPPPIVNYRIVMEFVTNNVCTAALSAFTQ
jgi:hypothetical protein